MSKLKERVAFVTGGSRGIGAAIVRRLVREGASVAFTYVRSDESANRLVAEIETAGGRALALKADGADASAVAAAIQEAHAKLGPIDILVNNAGIYETQSIEEFSIADFDRHIAVNVRAVFAAIKAAVPLMPSGSRIVTIGSNLAERATSPGLGLYAMTKAALTGMTKGAARDLGSRGITVNIIQPGSTDTDMNPAHGPGAADQIALRAVSAFNTADEVAGLVAYVVSPEARSITGAVLTIDGGANA